MGTETLDQPYNYQQAIIDFAFIHQSGKDATGGESIVSGSLNQRFNAASVSKLPIVTAMLHLAETNQFDLGSQTRIQLRELWEGNYGTGILRKTPQTLLRSVLLQKVRFEILMKFALAESDNMALLILANRIGRQRVQRVLNSWGMTNTSVYDPTKGTPNETTANDLAIFLRDFAQGRLLNPGNTTRVTNWLPSQEVTVGTCQKAVTVMHRKDGSTSQNGVAYHNRVGFVDSGRADRFVILTKALALPRGGISQEQGGAVEQLTENVLRMIPSNPSHPFLAYHQHQA